MNVEQAPKKYNRLAIISLILSIIPYIILSITIYIVNTGILAVQPSIRISKISFVFLLSFVSVLLALLSLILAITSIIQIKNRHEKGMWISILAIIVSLLSMMRGINSLVAYFALAYMLVGAP